MTSRLLYISVALSTVFACSKKNESSSEQQGSAEIQAPAANETASATDPMEGAGGPATGGGDCGGLRAVTKDICGKLANGSGEGLRCARAINNARKGEDCDDWVGSLEREWKESPRDESWEWGPKCQEYLQQLSADCLSLLEGDAEIPESCWVGYKDLIFETEKMVRVPDNASMAQAVEDHCAAQTTK